MRKMILTIEWVGGQNGYLKLIDQTKLPHKLTYLKCTTVEQVASAIKSLAVRGAPAIGVAAAFGAYLGMRGYSRLQDVTEGYTFASLSASKRLHENFGKVYQMLLATRPTAVNLKWALDRIAVVLKNGETEGLTTPRPPLIRGSKFPLNKGGLKGVVYREALKILHEDKETCYKIGVNGAKLVKNGYNILTHCNAGLLATAGIGTALAPMYIAKKQGRRFSVYSSETRPVLQGARLTVWELQRNHIPVTLICDNMVGSLMEFGVRSSEFGVGATRRGRPNIDLVIVGADRIARNGDTANKIGTYQVALLAHHHKIPFYVAAPMSTFSAKGGSASGGDIPIEFRSPDEVTQVRGKMTPSCAKATAGRDERGQMREVQIAPRHTKVYNPAFDVTPAKYIKGFITEKGIIKPEAITNYI